MSNLQAFIPDLELTPGAICRRKIWEGDGGYPEGEGVTIGEAKERGYVFWEAPNRVKAKDFVWSRDNALFVFRPEDLLADDWYITMPRKVGQG